MLRAATVALTLVLALAGTAAAAPTQPPQPRSGPGGSDYTHADWRVSEGGTGNDAWYVFEPVGPRPRRAPVAIMLHGYFEFAGFDQLHELIRHTVRKGAIVIYPRWQTSVVSPCAGPFDIEPCMASATTGIRGALAFLRGDPSRVQPAPGGAAYFGFSFGGVITTNLTNRHRALGLPRPRAVFLEDPHDGGYAGAGEPAVDDVLTGIPRDVRLQCHTSEDGVTGEPGKARSSCHAIVPKLTHIPRANRDHVTIRPDGHGRPKLTAEHGVCAAPRGRADAYDWGFCWKVWDALRSADPALRRYAHGPTREHRSNGRWSDGAPLAPLVVRGSRAGG